MEGAQGTVAVRLRVLVLDGDETYREALCLHLAESGMEAHGIGSGAELDTVLQHARYDVVICSVELEDETGFSIAARLRLMSDVGVILMTTDEKPAGRVLALSMGADHYVAKARDLREVEALVRSLYRRLTRSTAARVPATGLAAATASWVFDRMRWTLATPDGRAVTLSLAEHLVLGCLLERSGEVVPRERLLAALDRRDVRAYSRNIDMIVSRLRHKVGQASPQRLPVQAARGLGYVFTGPVVVI